MDERDRGAPTVAPVKPLLVRIERTPDADTRRVRFLSVIDGIYAHWIGSRDKGKHVPCQGRELCPPKVHIVKRVWQGFALAEYKQEGDPPAWIPCVWNVTQGLYEQLAGAVEIGDVFDFVKVIGDDGRKVPVGTFVRPSTVSPGGIGIDFHKAVERVYYGYTLQWCSAPSVSARQYATPRVANDEAEIEANERARQLEAERLDRAKRRELMEKMRKQA